MTSHYYFRNTFRNYCNFLFRQTMLTKIIVSILGHTHNVLFIVMSTYDMFPTTQYNMWYQFEAFLPIISLKPEYLNEQSIYKNKIYRIYWLHKDICIKKFLYTFNHKQQINRQKIVLTTRHIYSA